MKIFDNTKQPLQIGDKVIVGTSFFRDDKIYLFKGTIKDIKETSQKTFFIKIRLDNPIEGKTEVSTYAYDWDKHICSNIIKL